MNKRTMSLKEVVQFVPGDLPDGAFWQMAHDIAGAEYGEVWHELKETPARKTKNHQCPVCQKRFAKDDYMRQHQAAAHNQNKHKTKPNQKPKEQ